MDINKTLEETPSLKASIAIDCENLREKWQTLKEQYNHEEAYYILTEKVKNHILKSTDLKIMAQEDNKLFAQRLEIVKAEANYRKKEIEVNHLDDEFTSAKMLGRLQIAEMGSLNTELYGKEKKI